jgi:hypothetical protein
MSIWHTSQRSVKLVLSSFFLLLQQAIYKFTILGKPDELFDTYIAWAGKSKKGYYWEVQTMLLILCPDIMLNVALYKEKSKETATKV